MYPLLSCDLTTGPVWVLLFIRDLDARCLIVQKQSLKYTIYKSNLSRIVWLYYVFFFFVHSDWDGIMERDNQQDGEAEGVKICDPTSGSNPPGKLFNCSLKQL